MSLGRTLRTARHLRAEQIINRLTRRFARKPQPPSETFTLRRRPPRPKLPTRGTRISGHRLTVLNETREISGSEAWLPTDVSPLWKYHLHYFHYLSLLPHAEGRRWIEDWIQRCHPGTQTAWDPYPISLRVREWIEHLLAAPEQDDNYEAKVLANLGHQTEWLLPRLEFHLGANHLLENAITLCWSGLSLEGRRTERWLNRGKELLQRELTEQVLLDGTHYERCPGYQGVIAESLVRLTHIANDLGAQDVAALAQPAACKMLDALQLLTHPDGDICLFHDSTLDQGPRFEALAELASPFFQPKALPNGLWELPQGRFAGYRTGTTYFVMDLAGPQPTYNPGHYHNSALSFELSHQGERIVTDTGVLQYVPSAERTWDRSAAAHATAQIDDWEPAELWHGHRCGRRPDIGPLTLLQPDDGIQLRAATKYRSPDRQPARHERSVTLTVGEKATQLQFEDTLEAPGAHRSTVRIPLAPDLTATIADSVASARSGLGQIVEFCTIDGGSWKAAEAPYSTEFGSRQSRTTLDLASDFTDKTRVAWSINLLTSP